MNRINKVFSEKKTNILNIYFTAGYPQINDTLKIAKNLAKSGVDILEIGFPFSDPIADGDTIQKTSKQSLENGMTLNVLFEQLKDLRANISIPVLLMGYFNPILQYGVERFCSKCEEVGIDGLIIPDLPLEEFKDEYQALFKAHHIHPIFLISPQTSPERIRIIDSISSGFIYIVSSSTTTGAKNNFADEQLRYFQKIKDMKLKNPSMIGFGISNHTMFSTSCNYANGGIIGSHFLKLLENDSSEESIQRFVHTIKKS